MALLEIKDLHAGVEGVDILTGLNLVIEPGEVHAIMGPNGSGKSTLSFTLAGRDDYTITGGSALLDGHDLSEMSVEERARAGLFLALQYPVEIPGVTGTTFLRTAVNAHRTHRGEDPMDAMDFVKFIRAKASALDITDDMLKRHLNVGFSGGEKKRFEVLQMTALEPKVAILDETDSGLDIDAMKVVARGVNDLRSPDRGMLVITHYQRLLDYLVPDHVHVMVAGRIVESGGGELVGELERDGYARFQDAA
jgi:Fe-S cluster assembly ATP-binding protein